MSLPSSIHQWRSQYEQMQTLKDHFCNSSETFGVWWTANLFLRLSGVESTDVAQSVSIAFTITRHWLWNSSRWTSCTCWPMAANADEYSTILIFISFHFLTITSVLRRITSNSAYHQGYNKHQLEDYSVPFVHRQMSKVTQCHELHVRFSYRLHGAKEHGFLWHGKFNRPVSSTNCFLVSANILQVKMWVKIS